MDTKTLAENLQFLLDKARMVYGPKSEIKLVSRFRDNDFQIRLELYDTNGGCCVPDETSGLNIDKSIDKLSEYIMKQLKIHNEKRVSILEKQIDNYQKTLLDMQKEREVLVKQLMLF